jgi:hypothetical protein
MTGASFTIRRKASSALPSLHKVKKKQSAWLFVSSYLKLQKNIKNIQQRVFASGHPPNY